MPDKRWRAAPIRRFTVLPLSLYITVSCLLHNMHSPSTRITDSQTDQERHSAGVCRESISPMHNILSSSTHPIHPIIRLTNTSIPTRHRQVNNPSQVSQSNGWLTIPRLHHPPCKLNSVSHREVTSFPVNFPCAILWLWYLPALALMACVK